MIVPDLELYNVDSPQNLTRPNADSHSVKSRVQQVKNPTLLGTGLAHDGHLRSAVDKGLEGMRINLRVDVKHEHSTHALGVFLHRPHVLLVDQNL